LILSEYGYSSFPLFLRDGFYARALRDIEASVSRGSAGCGSAFWTLYSGDDSALTRADPYAVFASDNVYARVKAHASALAALAHAASSRRCPPGRG